MSDTMNTTTIDGFEAALAGFLANAQAMIDAYYAKNYPNSPLGAVLSCERGKRYVRVVKADRNGPSRSAYCFIDTTDGAVLKPASWKAPAKGKRGSIFGGPLGVGPHGADTWR